MAKPFGEDPSVKNGLQLSALRHDVEKRPRSTKKISYDSKALLFRQRYSHGNQRLIIDNIS